MGASIVSSNKSGYSPQQVDLDRCVHCGLCLNACPTYRELGLEMDSPRGRIYQMVQVSEGAPITGAYLAHIDLCLACRGCETACPSGVQYGRLVEAARADIETRVRRGIFSRMGRWLVFRWLLPSRGALTVAGSVLYLYETVGLKALMRGLGILRMLGRLGDVERLAPSAEPPFFFSQIGRTFPARGTRRYRVAFLSGCIANISFARLNEATVRVLQNNGCEVVVPEGQSCCGALHVHAGMREDAQRLARQNIDAVIEGDYDAIITNAAGCGSTLKEYEELLHDDAAYGVKAREFTTRMRDVTEFLASIDMNPDLGPIGATVTYQDSCHLAHGQKVRSAPRQLLARIPDLQFKELPFSDICCGSAGIYNVVHNAMSMQILSRKMEWVKGTGAAFVATANPGCMLQLQAGARLYGTGQRVYHVVELLDLSYRAFTKKPEPKRKEPKRPKA